VNAIARILHRLHAGASDSFIAAAVHYRLRDRSTRIWRSLRSDLDERSGAARNDQVGICRSRPPGGRLGPSRCDGAYQGQYRRLRFRHSPSIALGDVAALATAATALLLVLQTFLERAP